MTLINFVTTANESTATFRMRIAKPIELLNNERGLTATVSRTAKAEADINVFSKHFNTDEDQVAATLSTGCVVFDIADDHFDREHGYHYSYMVNRADIVTCNTPAMQERIYEVSGKLAQIIPDPVTFPEAPFKHASKPQYLWFGNAVNIMTIMPKVKLLPNLTIVTNLDIKNTNGNVRVKRWEPGLVESIIKDFDIVLLPRNNDPWASTKSPNRAVDAIMAGKFVITDFPEVYGVLAPFLFTGSIKDGILYYKNNPEKCQLMVTMGQEFIKKNYSDKAVTNAWLKALQLTSQRKSAKNV